MIQYNTIIDKYGTVYEIPIGSTPHEIASITGMSLLSAIEFFENSVVESEHCPTIYLSSVIAQSVQKNDCRYGVGTFTTVTVPAGMFSSQAAQEEADRKAQQYFDATSQKLANTLGTCNQTPCVCAPYRVVEVTPCGEWRRNTKCDECCGNHCIDDGDKYFVCLGNCRGSACVPTCTECSSTCLTGVCPNGYDCVDGRCIPNCTECSKVCKNSPCVNPCQSCTDGVCVDKVCPYWQHCENGVCVDTPCSPSCTSRISATTECTQSIQLQKCERGVCVDDLAQVSTTVPINEGQPCLNGYCRSGICSGNCIPACSQGTWTTISNLPCQEERTPQNCVSGNCVQGTRQTQNKINGTNCAGGSCLNGNCIPDCIGEGGAGCPNIQCCPGFECNNGICVAEGVPCNQTTTAGGEGVTTFDISLRPEGGLLLFDFQAFSIPDKFEIWFNTRMVATSGSVNVPNNTTVQSAQQFIGNDVIQSYYYNERNVEFAAFANANGFPVYTARTGNITRQLIWWKYTSNDYNVSHTAQVIVTGSSGTAWEFFRVCL